jgi:hypothetical protein
VRRHALQPEDQPIQLMPHHTLWSPTAEAQNRVARGSPSEARFHAAQARAVPVAGSCAEPVGSCGPAGEAPLWWVPAVRDGPHCARHWDFRDFRVGGQPRYSNAVRSPGLADAERCCEASHSTHYCREEPARAGSREPEDAAPVPCFLTERD